MSGDAKYSANGQPLFTDCFSPTETPDFRHRSSSPNSPQTSGTNSSNVDGLDAHIEKTSPPSAIATVKFAKQALRLIDQDEQDRANTKPSTTSSSDNQQPVGLDPPVEKTPPPSATAAVNISEQALLLMDQDGQHPANAKPPTNSASGNQQPVRLDAPVERHVRSDGKIGAVYNIDPEEYSLHLVGVRKVLTTQIVRLLQSLIHAGPRDRIQEQGIDPSSPSCSRDYVLR